MRNHRLPLILLLAAVALSPLRILGQTCPKIGVEALWDPKLRQSAWQLNHAITVAVDPDLAGCRQAFETVAQKWQWSGANRDFNVEFAFIDDLKGATLKIVRSSTCMDAGCFTPYSLPGLRGLNQAVIQLNPHADCAAYAQTVAHELGHGFGLRDTFGSYSTSIMGPAAVNEQGVVVVNPAMPPAGPGQCDSNAVQDKLWGPLVAELAGCPTYTPCTSPQTFDFFGSCQCIDPPPEEQEDPLLVDVEGNGIDLTDIDDGVWFDVDGSGVRRHVAWTRLGSDDGWLALDRNGNGAIDDARELFGNWTPQPASPEPNGFLALAEYDRAGNGGNGNGRIEAGDAIFGALRIWQDLDHDGLTDAGELRPLAETGLTELHLDYRSSSRRDEHGNVLRFRARVVAERSSDVGRWAYDVFVLYRP